MSGDCGELTCGASENAVSENNVEKTGKNLKRNYCYVCQVQCTAAKNLLEHQKGKKHQKNLSKPPDSPHQSFKTPVSNKKYLDKRETHTDYPDSLTNTDNITKKTMNNSSRQTRGNKRYTYINKDCGNKYSSNRNSKYSQSKNHKNQGFYNNSRPYCDYPQWNGQSANAYPDSYYNFEPGNEHLNFQYNAQCGNDYFSGNKYAVFNSNENLVRNTNLPLNPKNTTEKSNFSYCSPFDVKNSEARESKSNSPSLERSEEKTGLTCISNSNISATFSISNDKNDTNISEASSLQFSEINSKRLSNSKRMRSRSLSLSETDNSAKKIKDKIENRSLDYDSACEEQKIKEWTDSLLDTSHNKISRLLHPSTYKEKAAVNHLITKFSKSKRKESLTRNIRSNSLGSTVFEDMNDDENVNKIEESVTPESNISIILDSNKNSYSLEQKDFSKVEKNFRKVSECVSNSDQDCGNEQFSSVPNVKTSSSISMDENSSNFRKSNLQTYSRKTVVKKKEKSLHVESEKAKKRSSFDKAISANKKRKFYSPPEYFDIPSKTTELNNMNKTTSVLENSSNSDSVKAANSTSYVALPSVKVEIPDDADVNPSSSSTTNSQTIPNQTSEINSDISVETLIQLFASGSVKVKEEFNDPVMEAIKEISPDELINAYTNQSSLNKENETTEIPIDAKLQSPNDKSAHVIRMDETSNFANSAASQLAHSINITPSSVINNSSTKEINNSSAEVINNNSSTKDINVPSIPSLNVDKTFNNSIPEVKNLNLLHNTCSELPSHVNKLIKQLQEISSQEEVVKTNLLDAKSKINEINFLLEEWKWKKKKLQDEEEDLRKQRNEIIKALQGVIKTDGDEFKTSQVTEENIQLLPNNTQKSNDVTGYAKNLEKSYQSTLITSTEEKLKEKKNKTLVSPEFGEITILPSPIKPTPPEIIIIDDTEGNASVSMKNSKDIRGKTVVNVLPSESSFFDGKNITAHATIINCLVVFEGSLYTCSNDSTGKRFNLKDSTLAVTYYHTSKNVTEIVVEKVQNEALVLTSCSARIISLFIASSGTKIKTFFPPCPVRSICKGWGKFYSGLENGSVNVYNWKYEEREVVKTESPASRIDTAHQGRLHVLVILSSDGNIAIRDAETGLLIRYIKICVKHPSWMTVCSDFAFLSSSDKSLIILDIMSGKVEKRLYLSNQTTGLAVYEDYIFTVSYSGMITCFNKNECSDKTLYYGAGKSALTCVHVYQDWIFTGNRKGDVSLFQFDPNITFLCEFGKCDLSYGLKEDLEHHVKKDHLRKKNLSKCFWRRCSYTFESMNENQKLDHFKKHIYQTPIYEV